jgi:hypothetical protein
MIGVTRIDGTHERTLPLIAETSSAEPSRLGCLWEEV